MPVVRSHRPRFEQYSYSLRFAVCPPVSLNAHVGVVTPASSSSSVLQPNWFTFGLPLCVWMLFSFG